MIDFCSDKKINELRNKRIPLENELEKINKAVDALVEICEHDWNYTGHGHNYDVYKCHKCSETEER